MSVESVAGADRGLAAHPLEPREIAALKRDYGASCVR